nr:unnamed protein product [Callosobruchus analis]
MNTCRAYRNSTEENDDETNQIKAITRYPDGSVKLRNPHIELMDQDILYHLALGSGSHDLVEMFGDVKFVCMGGTPKRMEDFAHYIMKEIGYKIPTGTQLMDISQYSYRYCMYKVGPVLSVSHGMGTSSVSILLHEIIKLMYHAKCKDPIFFRIGTCGGIGIEGGTVVISDNAVDGMQDSNYAVELQALAHSDDPYDTVTGTTMCTTDFYEAKHNVTNIEMEIVPFAALTHHAGIRAAAVCVALLDRLRGDQVATPKEVMNEWQLRPQILVARYIKKYLQNKGRISFDGHGSIAVKSPRRFKLVQQESQSIE